jgi:glycosyltransferase involved in cell wall biosynthesis
VRILHLIWAMGGGGAERQLAGIAPELARRGHDVHVAMLRGGVHAQRLADGRCVLHRVPASFKYDPLLVLRVARLVRRIRPDVIHTWLTQMDIVGGAVARMLRVPWVLSERSAASSYPPVLLNRLRVAAGRRADIVAANSPGGAEYWQAHGFPAARIEIVPNFVPTSELDAAPPLDDARVAADDELLVHVGRLSPEKNLSTLIAAMEIVCRERPRARLALCGEGPLRDTLAAQVRAAGLQERVVFAGFVQNVASWLKRSSATVAVSLCEGHPNAVLEAIAAGVPLVLSDIPAYRAVVDETSASFTPVDDVRAMAAAIVGTLREREAALERALRARTAIASLTLDAAVTRFENVYARAVAMARDRNG